MPSSNHLFTRIVYLSIALALLAFSVSASAQTPNFSLWSQTAVDTLQQSYSPASGLYATTGWWNSANAITALANFSRLNHTKKYNSIFANTLRVAQTGRDGSPGFINKYYDDEGWWALAWIDVYDLTRDRAYLRMAESIFADMQKGWETPTCGGGVWWSKDNKDKNAIENELFLAVAASLANRETNSHRRRAALDWAHKEWDWFFGSGMVNAQRLINDGLTPVLAPQCKNNGQNPWTYNQGVILGALVELDKADRSPIHRQIAQSIALAAISNLVDANGILHEANGAHTGGDVPQFKGVFVRNLMILNAAWPNPAYSEFLTRNAQTLWAADRDASNHFGFWWAGPMDEADASRQSSALDLLNAAQAALVPEPNH